MKKTLSVALAVIMMFAMCIPAFAGAQMDALTGTTQKALAQLIQKQYDDSDKPGKKGALSQNGTPNYILANIDTVITDYSTVDLSTLEADVSAVYEAVVADLAPLTSAGTPLTANNISNMKTQTVKIVKNAIVKSGIFIASDKVKLLGADQGDIANLIIEAVNSDNTKYNATTAEGQAAIAEYILAHKDMNAYYEVYKADELKSTVFNDCTAAVIAVWDDNYVAWGVADTNQVALTESKTAASKIISDAINAKFAEMDKANGGGSSSITEWLDNLFKDFTNGDFSEMFGGFGDAIKKIGSAISSLFGGLFPSGDDTTTTTKKSSSSSNGTNSIPKTGDVALYSVAALSLAAGIALVLTKKKKNDK